MSTAESFTEHDSNSVPAIQQEHNRHVSMSNRLARAAHGLNLAEKRLVALGLAGTDSVPADDLARGANVGWMIRISALEYATTFEVDPRTAYEQLQTASEKLFERHVSYEDRDKRDRPVPVKFRWISAVRYFKGEGYVELNFSPEIAPHLLGLRSHFTTYELKTAAPLDTIYAWRLFELLKSWRSTGRYTTSIEDFWDSMEAPPSARKDFKQLRTRIIDPSIEQIQAKTDLVVTWNPMKAGGRRITSLEFIFGPSPQRRLELDAQ